VAKHEERNSRVYNEIWCVLTSENWTLEANRP
jgi:hypothetical protein